MSRNLLKRLAIVAVILALVAAFKLLHLDQYLTLEYLKSSQERFASLYAARPALVIGSYVAIYILVTSLSLPGAAVLTLAGGALFGFIAGTVIVSFASSIGATLACLVARFLLRDWVQGKFGERLTTVNQGIDREGAFYLFTLRLIPIFPFFVINLVMGLTKMPVLTFYWVSQVGMIPGTMVYVNAGRELARIESLSGILSPGLIASFVLIGVFPLITKKVLSLYRAKRGTHT
ncbi:MAG TPA: TVP38/TMEM64 family protein [Dissulfurispiraceae bacterium]|nr:TVP38/TMEM64 family protein [Dissulfurispiraceae bacterium]